MNIIQFVFCRFFHQITYLYSFPSYSCILAYMHSMPKAIGIKMMTGATPKIPGNGAIALDWDSYRQVLEDLLGLDVSDKAWESTIKGGENYNLINKDTAVFGVGDFGAEEPYFNTESIIFEDGKWIVKGKFAFVFIEGGARKYSYRIVAEENPHSIFGHLTVQKLKVTKE